MSVPASNTEILCGQDLQVDFLITVLASVSRWGHHLIRLSSFWRAKWNRLAIQNTHTEMVHLLSSTTFLSWIVLKVKNIFT